MEYLTGRNSAKAALTSATRILSILIQENLLTDEDLSCFIRLAEEKGIPWQKASKIELANLSGTENHQGVLVRVGPYQYKKFREQVIGRLKKKEKALVLILDHLYDPQNLGSILRTAHAFNVDVVVIPKDRSVSISPVVVRVSAGSSELIDVCQESNINGIIKELKDNGFWVYGADSNLGQDCRDVGFDTKMVLVLGSEKKGLSKLVRENCDFLVKVKINEEVNSLNVGAAASVLLYEVSSQHGTISEK